MTTVIFAEEIKYSMHNEICEVCEKQEIIVNLVVNYCTENLENEKKEF